MNKLKYNFYINKSRLNGNNQTTIQCRINLNKKEFTLSTQISVTAKNFDNVKKKIKGNTKEAEIGNEKLHLFSTNLSTIILEADRKRELMSIDKLKERILGIEHKGYSVLEIFDKYAQRKANENKKGTIRNREIRRKNIADFLKYTFDREDVIYEKMKKFHAEDMYLYFTKVKKSSHNHSAKIITELKASFQYAVRREMVNSNVFEAITYSQRNEKTYEYLEKDQLEHLERYNFGNEFLEKTADIFLFLCYTGLSFCDYESLSTSDLQTTIDTSTKEKIVCIEKIRQKSQIGKKAQRFCVPIFENAQKIIDKYGGIETLPKICQQKCNVYLKEIGKLLSIKSPILKTHVGRKTFGNILLNYNNYSVEAVAAMMGDNVATVIAYYTKPNKNRVIHEFLKNRKEESQ